MPKKYTKTPSVDTLLPFPLKNQQCVFSPVEMRAFFSKQKSSDRVQRKHLRLV